MKTKEKQAPSKEISILERMEPSTSDPSLWYSQIFRNRNKYRKTPTSIQQYKQSHPYRLVLHKIQGLALTKKSGNNDLFLNLSGMLFTESFQILGAPFQYQFQLSFGRTDNKWEHPVALYFHSRIDKNYEGLYLFIRYKVIEIKDCVVENTTEIGTMIIKNPLVQENNKSVPVYKDVNQVDFGYSPPDVKTKILSSSSTITAQYSLQSMLELKKIVKLMPENAIFSHQDHITGIHSDYLPKEIQDLQLQDARSVQITVNYMQVHLSQRFQQDLLAYFKKCYPNEKATDIKGRKIVIGFHNQYVLVNPCTRKLELVDKEVSGQTKILIFQGLKDGQILKIPFFSQNESSLGMMVAGLIYQIGSKELQLACSYFLPVNNGEEINQSMKMGEILGSMYQLFPFTTKEAPTIILQYSCNLQEAVVSVKDDAFGSAKQLKGGKSYINQQLLAQERERLKQQIEREKQELQKEKQEMEKLKMEKDIHYQAEFQKKFQVEKENLYKRQQMIENQYKEQVEREIREKFQLEEEVKKMMERIKNLQDNTMRKGLGESGYQSPREDNYQINERLEYQPELAIQMPPIRQRMDPGYIIQPENMIPVKKVREILEKTSKNQSQLVKQSEEAFNFASKFTFTFTSVVWSGHIDIPKSIYLLIKFFNQRQLRTENLGYFSSSQGGYHQLVKISHLNKGFQDKEASYSFTIDPSQYHQPSLLQKDLTHYLLSNNAIIDIFSGDTHLYIGQINIKLKELLRGTKTQTMIAKELNLVKIKNKEVLGVMQILIKNEQVSCKDEVSLKHEKKVKELKKKVVSNNPIFISPEERMAQVNKADKQVQSIRSKNLNMNRQELRIQKFKEQKSSNTFASTANNFSHLDQSQKGVALGQIASYKERKIQDFLKGAYENLLNQKIIISAHYGKAVTFPFLFTNTSQTPASYKISVLYVQVQNVKELTVVKSNKQWRYLASKHNYAEPKRYDLIGQNNTFFLQPGQSIPLVFKYLTFHSQQAKVGHLYTKERVMNVTICKEDNNWIAGGFSLLVNLHQQIIHHSYILYEPGEQIVDLIVPVIFSQTDNNSNTKKLHLTNEDPNANAVWLNAYEILIRIPTPKIMEKLKFNLLLYEDQFFCELTQNWLIEVYAYQGVCTTFRADFNTRFKITLPWSAVPAHLGLLSLDRVDNCLNLFASNAGLIFKDNIIELMHDRKDQGSYEIWCELIGSENLLKNFEITCVSGEEDQLLYGWVVTVYPYTPRT